MQVGVYCIAIRDPENENLDKVHLIYLTNPLDQILIDVCVRACNIIWITA